MLIRMFVTNWVARLGGWLDWVAKTLALRAIQPDSPERLSEVTHYKHPYPLAFLPPRHCEGRGRSHSVS